MKLLFNVWALFLALLFVGLLSAGYGTNANALQQKWIKSYQGMDLNCMNKAINSQAEQFSKHCD